MKSIAEWYVLLGVIDPQIMYSSAVYEICYQIMKYPPYAMQAISLTILTIVSADMGGCPRCVCNVDDHGILN